MTFALGFIYMIVTGAVLVSMTTLHLRGERTISNKMYLVFQGMVALWCVSQIMVLLSENIIQLRIAYLVGNIGICFTGVFLYFFSVTYTGRRLKGMVFYIPLLLSSFHFLCVLTNPFHHCYYRIFSLEKVTHGIFFYTNVIETYVFVMMGAVLLYRRMEGMGRSLIILSVLVPVMMNAIYITGLVRADFDITPLGFAVSVILVMWATVKYQFLDLRRELEITNEKLLLEQERNRIAQQVHDTAGHTLTMIQSYMKLADVSLQKNDIDAARAYSKDARQLTSRGIRELRESINQLRQEASYELVTQGVMQLANQVKELKVEVTVQGTDSKRYSHLSKTIYDTVRESITNTLKYANASQIEIILRFHDNDIEMLIGDDGNGCEIIVDNNGLYGIRERIEEVNGSVRFQSSKGEGFLTRVKIPL